MRRYTASFLAVLAVGLFVGASVARAKPYESFTLDTGDRIIAETPGCFASCTIMGTRRNCTVKDFDCRAVCTELRECKLDGVRPMKVCAIVRETAR